MEITNGREKDSKAAKSRAFDYPWKFKWYAFFITYLSYAVIHANRKTFGNVKHTMSSTWTPQDLTRPELFDFNQWNKNQLFSSKESSTYFLGLLDSTFMVPYSVGLYISGAIGDRYNLRKVMTFGLISSSLSVILFGTVSEMLQLYSQYWYPAFWALTGVFQSIMWPAVVAIIGNWFGKKRRGLMIGLWGSASPLGNMMGSFMISYLLPFGYEYVFIGTGCLSLSLACLVFFGLVSTPREVGLPEVEETLDPHEVKPLLNPPPSSSPSIELQEVNHTGQDKPNPSQIESKLESTSSEDIEDLVEVVVEGKPTSTRPQAINFLKACFLPGVIAYSICYAGLKFVNYSFFFWLPYYLQDTYHWQEAESGFLSTFYDAGGIVGGTIGGVLSDHLGYNSPVVGFMLICSVPSLLVYYFSPNNKTLNGILMSIVGFFISGLDTMIGTLVATDLGKQSVLRDNAEALSTVTGIIDGTGSIGAAIGQVFIPLLKAKAYGNWGYIFMLFVAMIIITFCVILKIIIQDLRRKFGSHKAADTSATNNEL